MKEQEKALFDKLKGILPTAWTASTSSDPEAWHRNNPAWGQCAVTALVIQDLFGGDLLRSETLEPDGVTKGPSHYFNRLPDGQIVDLTREQFDPAMTIVPPELRTRQQVLQQYPKTMLRYGWLVSIIATRFLDMAD